MHLSYELDLQRLKQLLDLDAIVYPTEQQGDVESVWERYVANRDTYTILLDSHQQPIGYLCAFPIDQQLYSEIKQGQMPVDAHISSRHILPYHPGFSCNLYLISIVITPEFQGSEALKHLLRGFAEKIEALRKCGIHFNRILAQAISAKGHKLLKSLDFRAVFPIQSEEIVMEAAVDEVIHIIHNRLNLWRSGE